MKIDSKSYRVPSRKKVDLGKWPTSVDPYYKSKEQYKELLQQHMEKLSSLQDLQPPAVAIDYRRGAIARFRSALNLQGGTVQRMKWIEDRDFGRFRTQGTVAVVFSPGSAPHAASVGVTGSVLRTLTSCSPPPHSCLNLWALEAILNPATNANRRRRSSINLTAARHFQLRAGQSQWRTIDDVSCEAPEAGRLPRDDLNAIHQPRHPCSPTQHQDRLSDTVPSAAPAPRHASPIRLAPLTRNPRTYCTRKNSPRIS